MAQKGCDYMPRIIPIKDLKDTGKMSELCHNSNEPVFITKNGYGDMVLMSLEVYEEMRRKESLYRELETAETQIAKGKVAPAREALAELRKKYGL